MDIRLDKCSSFGMLKKGNQFSQILPNVWLKSGLISATPLNKDFTYLGKLFNFNMSNESAKAAAITKLDLLLDTTSSLPVKPQMKLKILKTYVSSQIAWDLKLYNFPGTWVEQNLDSRCVNHVRDWIEAPISSCVSEWLHMPPNKGGMGIISIKSKSQRLALSKRHSLKASTHEDISNLWKDSTLKNIETDSLLLTHSTFASASKELKLGQNLNASNHLLGLSYQGKSLKCVIEQISTKNISLWSTILDSTSACLFNFARKAVQQQLATAANLARWNRIQDPNCTLCKANKPQTNKHVLSNCESPTALQRYTTRHNNVLALIVNWLTCNLLSTQILYSDLDDSNSRPVRDLFQSFRPDIAVADNKFITVLELTICHETNLLSSKEYKTNKYLNLSQNASTLVGSRKIRIFTLEVSTIGFISDSLPFTAACKIPTFSRELKCSIITSVLKNSFDIYCSRNSM
jgi:hypothetical protein